MVMTRKRFKRQLEQDQPPHNHHHHHNNNNKAITAPAAIHGQQQHTLSSTSFPAFTSPLLHQGVDAQTSVDISSAQTCSLNSDSKEVPSCLITLAAAKINKPPLQVHPLVKPCSVTTLERYPTQLYKRVPCRRNKSAAALGAIKKTNSDGKVADGICVSASLSEVNHNPAIQDSTTQLIKGSECIRSLSPSPLLLKDVNGEVISNEHRSLTEVMMPIDEDRSDGLNKADSNASQETSLNLSAMDTLDDDGSSIDSELSSVAVTIGGYRVKENLAPTLKDILSKYGDIAAQCCKKSIMLRSLLVENVCDIVQKLQTADFVHLTPVEIDNFRVFVQDMESDGVEIGWLLHRLNEIHEAKRLLKVSSKVKQDRSQICQAIKEKEEQICELQEKIASAKKELDVERAEERKLDEILSYTKSQVKRFYCRSMMDGLL